ncbi:thiamine diphosphokinase [Olsenella sp. HMSC062G07]|uniref:thiamine diphosphokinase n=1 Tax=Olsenella sp. HMSC062G07 TaxID=1739330 RepID=UPI0008A6168A|nr:thiamine diphosphokinase [Olsenella sp. HMSC062G07]OFK24586.1 hypothetical protein HMPREF2826_06720 [Olsenella sp. HMSC062G07]
MRIETAIFDLDGTIVDSMGAWRAETISVLADQGVENPDEIFDILEPEPLENLCRIVHDSYGAPAAPEALEKTLKARMREAYAHTIRAYPGCRSFLEELRGAGVRLCVASASPLDMVELSLRANDLDGLFEFVLSASEVGKGKEEPDVYLEAHRRLGGRRATCWVFEDSPVGIRTARRAGFPTVCVYDVQGHRPLDGCRGVADIFSHGYVELSLALIRDFERPRGGTSGVLDVLVIDGSSRPSTAELVSALAREAQHVIAADRGACYARAAGVVPDVFCGDADSIDDETRAWVLGRAGTVVTFPAEKYATDLSCAIDCAAHEAARREKDLRLTVTCASGGRADHALAVLGLLASHARARARLVEDDLECRILSPQGSPCWELGDAAVGRTLSVIALAPGSCVSEKGLRWELDRRELPLLGDEGVSNVVEAATARVSCHAGVVAAFLLR